MRYFFDVIDDPIQDDTGQELASLETAKHHALHYARDLLQDRHISGLFCQPMSIQVRDEAGRAVYQLDISATEAEQL